MNLDNIIKKEVKNMYRGSDIKLVCFVSLFESVEITKCDVNIVCSIQTGVWTTPGSGPYVL